MPLLHVLLGKSTWYILDRWMGRSQRWFVWGDDEKNLCLYQESNHNWSACNLVTILSYSSLFLSTQFNTKNYSNFLTILRLIAVACAAILVPLRAFLKPSIPHDLNNFTAPATEKYSLWYNNSKYMKELMNLKNGDVGPDIKPTQWGKSCPPLKNPQDPYTR